MKIYRRIEPDEHEEVAKVLPNGEVSGESPTANKLAEMLSDDGIYIPNYNEDHEDCFVTEGIDMILYLEGVYSSGYFSCSLEEEDFDIMEEYQSDRSILDKQGSGGPPAESPAPSDCNPQYIDDPNQAPEGAEVYDGVQNEEAFFYCSNYLDIGAVTDEFDDVAEEQRGEINERLSEEHQLDDHEHLAQKDAEDVVEGEDVIVHVDDSEELQRGTVNAHMVTTGGDDVILIVDPNDDSQGAFLDYSEWDDEVEGVVVEGIEGEEAGQWEDYERPREIYSPQFVEEKQNLREYMDRPQGVNSEHTYIVRFDNDEKAIYKPNSANAYEESVRTDVAWYELAQRFSDDPTYAPETAAADLKNGLGSAQQWIERGDTYGEVSHQLTSDDREHIALENVEDVAEISLMDYVLGNDDRHQNNVLIDRGQLYAIDNGGYGTPSATPREENLTDSINILLDIKSVRDREEAFETVAKKQREMLDEMVENKEEVMNMARSMYGADSWLTDRIRRMFEGEDPDILEDHLDGIEAIGEKMQMTEDVIEDVMEDLQ